MYLSRGYVFSVRLAGLRDGAHSEPFRSVLPIFPVALMVDADDSFLRVFLGARA